MKVRASTNTGFRIKLSFPQKIALYPNFSGGGLAVYRQLSVLDCLLQYHAPNENS